MVEKGFEKQVCAQRAAFDLLVREGLIPPDEKFSPKFEKFIEGVERDLQSLREEKELQSMGVLGPEVEEASLEAAEFWATFSSGGGL